MFIIYNSFGHRLEASKYHVLNLLVTLIDLVRAVATHEIEFHAAEIPLSSKFLVVIVRSFLNGDVCQMHESVGEVIEVVTVP